MYTVYILQSTTTGQFYIGQTKDIVNRIKRHIANRERSTKQKGPWKLVYKESYLSRQEAVKREKTIKSYKSGNAFKALLRPAKAG